MVAEVVQDGSEIRRGRLGQKMRLDDTRQLNIQRSIPENRSYTQRFLRTLRPPFAHYPSELSDSARLRDLEHSPGVRSGSRHPQPGGTYEEEQGWHTIPLLVRSQMERRVSENRHSIESSEPPLQCPLLYCQPGKPTH